MALYLGGDRRSFMHSSNGPRLYGLMTVTQMFELADAVERLWRERSGGGPRHDAPARERVKDHEIAALAMQRDIAYDPSDPAWAATLRLVWRKLQREFPEEAW